MLTVCPKCTLTLAVTAGDLRTGQGYVRCGRCAAVFNALLTLNDEIPVVTPTLAALHKAEMGIAEQPDLDDTLDPVPDAADFGESHGNETMETIVLEGDGVMQTEEFVDITTIAREISEATLPRIDVGNLPPVYEPQSQPFAALLAEEAEAQESAEALTTANESDSQPIAEAVHSPVAVAAVLRPRPWMWASAAALLLLLAVQLIHHWRNDLALNPTLKNLLDGPYQQLGMPLFPNYQLSTIDLLQLGGGSNAKSQAFHVQLRLVNRANYQQPFPVIRLRLYSRYGKLLNTWDLAPTDYLPVNLEAGPLMAVQQNYDSEIAVGDAAKNFASFELDVCVPAPGGLRCAADRPGASKAQS